jgi:hypothetical protein
VFRVEGSEIGDAYDFALFLLLGVKEMYERYCTVKRTEISEILVALGHRQPVPEIQEADPVRQEL